MKIKDFKSILIGIILLLSPAVNPAIGQTDKKIETKAIIGLTPRLKLETSFQANAQKIETTALIGTVPLDIDSTQITNNSFDIGVIAGESDIPEGIVKEKIMIYMDDEDKNNEDKHNGWIGAISQDRNTTFRFWRVDGRKLKPFSQPENPNLREIYAVLKLGDYCPCGSYEFTRYFDNEDNNNTNKYSGNISPNWQNRNTGLKFCIFIAGYDTMNTFPNIAQNHPYGVFAAPDFKHSLETGYLHTDDEDHDNANYFSGMEWVLREAKRIIPGDRNTSMGIVRVK